MPRTSWLPRLSEIHRSVHNSVRSFYDQKEIRHLFALQPRAAQQLMNAVKVGKRVGRSHLIERADLEAFLDEVAESKDPEVAIRNRRRKPKSAAPGKRLQDLLQSDVPVATLDAMPANVTLRSGRLTIDFTEMQDLVQGLLAMAQVLEQQFEEFQSRYEPTGASAPLPEKEQEESR
jgi:hypothetical protein